MGQRKTAYILTNGLYTVHWTASLTINILAPHYKLIIYRHTPNNADLK